MGLFFLDLHDDQALFRRFSIKAWKGSAFKDNKHAVYNRTVNQHCVSYYCKRWKDRNEKLHDEEVQRKRVIEFPTIQKKDTSFDIDAHEDPYEDKDQ